MKFAAPPVKVACLACRASRTRCDGGQTCHNCLVRNRECYYVPSKRGGSRRTRANPSNADILSAAQPSNRTSQHCSSDFTTLEQIGHLISPGAGLKRSEYVEVRQEADIGSHPGVTTNLIGDFSLRVYESEQTVLNAYYTYIHQYFPILPPPISPLKPDRPIHWSSTGSFKTLPYTTSPLSLAISAVLALIPLRQEEHCDTVVSTAARSSLAQRFAHAALEHVETDSEFLDFTTAQPPGSLDEELPISRTPFHPQTPAELESVLALLILSNYEHAQRGNLLKMTSRASQALVTAKNLSLHRLGSETDRFSEARRRAWWMTYYYAHLCSVVRQSASINVDDDSEFTTPYPRLEADPEAWTIFIESLRISVASVRFTASHKTSIMSQAEASSMYEQMGKLDRWVVLASARAEPHLPVSSTVELDPASEFVTSQVMRRICRIRFSSARIRIHRYHAFSDMPLFGNNHCDLTPTDILNVSSSVTVPITNTASGLLAEPTFTCDQSAGICVESALTISRQLQNLPTPNADYAGDILSQTMPTTSCCAMQASYALLMQFCRLRVMSQIPVISASSGISAERLVEELRHGLDGIIAAMEGFAGVFQAISGMTDEVDAAYQVAFQVTFPELETNSRS
ncbi:fungal Zn binuclear cluster domain-containing protein [Dactylonectria estremocensis]|uniref:Fungal Zn binuclear cluster domain-containing protein n=1 Tax=Dactylonectria estremocensis TaxID=1079267 RepID=A0A9P9ER11_9HYPO|nr:fungal Zn binuclear cluster domain-containing protein [Dactylonectria estremocensis]